MATTAEYLDQNSLLSTLSTAAAESLDFVVLITGAMRGVTLADVKDCLAQCVSALRPGGILFVQGTPGYLPELGIYLDRLLTFKYWIAVESDLCQPTNGLPSRHAAILMFTKGNGRFNVGKLRFPHEYCAFCGRPVRDWGGKTHLMNPNGYAASDVWKGLPSGDNYHGLSAPVMEAILKLLDAPAALRSNLIESDDRSRLDRPVRGVIGPYAPETVRQRVVAEPASQYWLPGLEPPLPPAVTTQIESRGPAGESSLWDTVHHGDALDVLKRYPDASVDLVFADPPYNLDKAYNTYNDGQRRDDYLAWCNSWLEEYIRILKPTGSLYVLNLPRWTMYHAAFLNRRLYFQNWIVWDALSEPRGKIMPAHYGLLYYTRHPTDFTFNYDEVGQIDARYYCLRSSCIHRRKAAGVDDKQPLTDIWWDIHRLKHRRDRDYHPCQLPDALLERIIRLSSNPGDIVLDALAGTGTTAVLAAQLGRRYVAIDIDQKYVQITREKLTQVQAYGHIRRRSISRPRPTYTKKALQLELRDLALRLGRLPTPDDVKSHSRYELSAFLETFPSWGKALKAAKLIGDLK